MRTLLVAGALVVLAVVCGASLVVKAQGAPAATLEHRCTPRHMAKGIDTVVRCSFTAHNTGGVVLRNLQLSFGPGRAMIPDLYYFMGAHRDGAPIEGVTPSTLNYAFGDLAPSASSTIDVLVVVRSQHPYGAEATLSDGAATYATVEVGSAVSAPVPVWNVGLYPGYGGDGRWSGGPWRLTLKHTSDSTSQTLRDVHAEIAVAGGAHIAAPQTIAATDFPELRVIDIGDVTGGASVEITLAADRCAYVQMAAVLTGESDGARVELGAISPSGTIGTCTPDQLGQGVGGDTETSVKGLLFPATGSGGAGGTRIPAPLLLLAVGVLVLAAGISVRRVR